MSEPCEVHGYSIEKLLELFAEHSKASSKKIEAKLHAIYFREYFNCISAKTIIVENEYVDRDYLEDYAEYYVRCFRDYPRKCTRLHFFKVAFSSEDFSNSLLGNSDSLSLETLQTNYLGFIVLKPLPRTIIGRTCLITYPCDGRRHFPATRCYVANLFGLNLKVQHSLAFQEQDSVVAACATSALWSIFQATGQLFQHPIPSPSAITSQATEILTKDQRAFPSPGLTSIEMAHAIKSVGLEPYLVNAANHYLLKATLYAYLRAGIPMMFGFHLIDVSGSESQVIGKHAVAITGYSLGYSQSTFFENTGFLLKATKVDKIYVHDDQVGPFSRMVFDEQLITLILPDGKRKQEVSILTSWQGNDGSVGGKRAISDILLIPLYHKIRIPFGAIHDIVFGFDSLLKSVISQVIPALMPIFQQAEWDIYLISVNDLKKEIFGSVNLNTEIRKKILMHSFPRFLWRASLILDGGMKLDLLFDATDIEQGAFFLCVIDYDKELTGLLRILFNMDEIESLFDSSPAWPIVAWFRENL
jgi:hypothetical protein